MTYFHTNDEHEVERLAYLLNMASESGRSVRLDVDSEGNLRVKIGEGMWTAPTPSSPDPYRDVLSNEDQARMCIPKTIGGIPRA